MNKKILFTIIILLAISLTACGKRDAQKDVMMDQLATDNKFHYTNKDLGFLVDFPEEFLYYQTQRNKGNGFDEIEFFVPTSDRDYPQDIQSYGKFLVVRVFDKDKYTEEEYYKNFGEKEDRVYVGILWDQIPLDWKDKWTGEMGEEIIDSFKIN